MGAAPTNWGHSEVSMRWSTVPFRYFILQRNNGMLGAFLRRWGGTILISKRFHSSGLLGDSWRIMG